VEINQLRYFLSVVEVGSFSKAALHCYISQPALSEQIQRLEDEVGKTLLHRNPKKIVPTEAGFLLVGRAKSALAQIEMAKREIKGLDQANAAKMTFGVLPTVAPYLLGHVMESFTKQCPQIEITIHEGTTPQLLKLIENGKLDLGIVSLPVSQNGFEKEVLFSEEMLLAMPAFHPLAKKSTIHIGDLVSEKFIMLQDGHCLEKQVTAFCKKNAICPQCLIRCGQLGTIQSLVAAGSGISLIPQMAIRETPKKIIYRRLENPKPKRDIAAVTKTKRPLKKTTQWFMRHLRQVALLLPVINDYLS
jgi:LysR family hydrogen peroxide-inducible transcriptional activator